MGTQKRNVFKTNQLFSLICGIYYKKSCLCIIYYKYIQKYDACVY